EALGGTSLMDANGLAESVDSQADESDGTGQPTHPDEANWLSEIEAPGDTSLMDADGLAESVDSEVDSESEGSGEPALHDDGQPVSNDWSPAWPADALAFLRQGLVS